MESSCISAPLDVLIISGLFRSAFLLRSTLIHLLGATKPMAFDFRERFRMTGGSS